MTDLRDALQAILSKPTPVALVTLQGALLAAGERDGTLNEALDIAGHFHAYLSELETKVTAKEYSELASRLDISAVGVVALENMVATQKEKFWQRLILGFLGEGLMVAASRQYVKGWEAETGLVHAHTAWYLTEALWHASAAMQPDLAAGERWQAIQTLLAPAYGAGIPEPDKALLLSRIFQMLLLIHLSRLSLAS
jgi:hypothetical protein